MKPAKKKKIGQKDRSGKKAVPVAVRVTVRKEVEPKKEIPAPKPLTKIASGLRSRILNAKAIEKGAAAKKPAPEMADTGEFEVKKTKIKIIGIVGGGGNIVSEIAQRVKKSSFCVANTDFAALRNVPKTVTVFHFGESKTHGLGTGMDPKIAEEAAIEEKEKIKKMMEGQDLVIIVSSLGGGAGSGAAPVFAQISKGLGNLTYGIFTLPFVFEGAKKEEIARTSLEKLKPYMNALTILPNERVFEVVPKNTPFSKTLSYINTMLSDSLEGLIETIYDIGVINIDFADLRTVLAGNGKMAFLNTIRLKKGEEANLDSFEKAFSSPLYPYTIDKAKGLLLNIVAQKDLRLLEVNKILTSIAARIHKEAKIIFGVGHEGALPGEVKVTVLATGCVYGAVDGAANGEAEGGKETEDNGIDNQKKEIEHHKVPAPPARRKIAPPKPNREVKEKKENKVPVKKAVSAKKVKITKIAPAKKDPEPQKAAGNRNIEEIFSVPQPKPAVEPAEEIVMPENPVRKNALQVKKEIEMEEKEMMEKERIWDVPAFLRKQQKNNQ
ncbi:MAG: cell division FtsZ family protein [Candidatus Pacebacteria bacterium]|nr:cell division FtsZ family protein [Candidatus Paceibacterota bacterium]